jgi:hypothetical protein
MPVARQCPYRMLRPRGAILLAKPAEPPVGSRGAREAASAAEAGTLRGQGPWRLVISAAHRCTDAARQALSENMEAMPPAPGSLRASSATSTS